jgi:hypothetical protein
MPGMAWWRCSKHALTKHLAMDSFAHDRSLEVLLTIILT